MNCKVLRQNHKNLEMFVFPPPKSSIFYDKMIVSAREDENATFHFLARIIDNANEKQWVGDPSRAPQPHEPHRHSYHCFSLAISMILAKKWNAAFPSPWAETFIFVVVSEHFGGRETKENPRFRDFVPRRYHLCFET